MKRAIIFDIDGTLADCSHRRHFVEGEKKDWDAFYSEMVNDTPKEAIVFLCKAVLDWLYRSSTTDKLKVFIFTGRPENYRQQTEEWLHKTLGWHTLLTNLYMRPAGDYRPDYQVKQEMLDKLKAEGYEVLFTVDDRKQVVDMWRRNGVTCLQCAEGDF
ncbi:HAD family acid phosphatase [Parasutterella secunda]|uniref:Polynucleotide kinase PNKP phosphatase domain-containing protein n=1 Tax=Parasutterella secunda TaxID=626947 RepID=A0ABS2GS27_9BURK|nr:HAD family acid phosphatase [Parasutterella secunda]MBM6928154.1 hypothetical protein [Parasutterella secunda]